MVDWNKFGNNVLETTYTFLKLPVIFSMLTFDYVTLLFGCRAIKLSVRGIDGLSIVKNGTSPETILFQQAVLGFIGILLGIGVLATTLYSLFETLSGRDKIFKPVKQPISN